MLFGCTLPGVLFKPAYTGLDKEYAPLEGLLRGYEEIRRCGFDYIEASVGTVRDLTEEEVDALVDRVRAGTFALPYVNGFVPSQISLCTDPPEQIEAYVCTVLERLHRLQVRTVVFGSGGARRRPEDMAPEQAQERIDDFLRICARECAKYGIVTAIEPLNRGETNTMNTVADAAQTIRRLRLPQIRLLPDMFHMALEAEPPQTLADNADLIDHLHAADAPKRGYPGSEGGVYLRQCSDVLRQNGIDADITVECGIRDFPAEAVEANRFLRKAFA